MYETLSSLLARPSTEICIMLATVYVQSSVVLCDTCFDLYNVVCIPFHNLQIMCTIRSDETGKISYFAAGF